MAESGRAGVDGQRLRWRAAWTMAGSERADEMLAWLLVRAVAGSIGRAVVSGTVAALRMPLCSCFAIRLEVKEKRDAMAWSCLRADLVVSRGAGIGATGFGCRANGG